MDLERFAEVDAYLERVFGGIDDVLDAALARAEDAALPAINVSAPLGRLLQVLAMVTGAGRVLEVGTLGGYSTIWLARALPADGRLVTIEYEPTHAEVARQNLADAGVADRVDLHVGRGLDVLADLAEAGTEPFDFVFIDADKPAYADYLDATLRLSRPGTLIFTDNVVRGGAIADGDSDDPVIAGVQRFLHHLAGHPRLRSSVIQQVGGKGYDGFAVSVVLPED
ncbi:MAG TPA: O-methyltransferase [Egicoccus sp.]|nr:O-methyltransferase [Egicoccus sp.]HSK22720.1 O-methyltransferase [Egicoccus sp.]